MAKRCLINSLMFAAVFLSGHVVILINLLSPDGNELLKSGELDTSTVKLTDNTQSQTTYTEYPRYVFSSRKDGNETTSKTLLGSPQIDKEETTTLEISSHISTGKGSMGEHNFVTLDSWDLDFNERLKSHGGNTSITNCSKEEDKISLSVVLKSQCKDWACSELTCYCDVNCLILQDCCLEMFNSVFQLNYISDVSAVIRNPREFLDKYNKDFSPDVFLLQNYSSCRSIVIELKPMYETMLVVDKCPTTFKEPNLIKTFCEQMDENDIRNVYTSQKTGMHIIYRNIFCAFCHQLTVEQLVVWKMEVNCPNGFVEKESSLIDIQSSCNTSFEVPSYLKPPRKCFPQFISTREIEQDDERGDETLSMLCSSFYEPIKFHGDQYKNRFCLPYGEIENTTKKQCIDGSNRRGSLSPELVPGYDLLFSISDDGLTWNGNKIEFFCDKYHIYDIQSQTCRRLSCFTGFVLSNGECILSRHFNNSLNSPFENGISNAFTYHLELSLSQKTTLNGNTTETNAELSLRKILDFIDACNEFRVPVIESLLFNATSVDKSYLWTAVVNVTSPKSLSLLLSCLQNVAENITDLKHINIRNFINKTNLSCPKQILKQVNLMENMPFYKDTVMELLDFNISIDLFFTRFDLTLGQSYSHVGVLYFCFPFKFQLNCTQILSYNSEEFSFENDTLVIFGRPVSAEHFYIEKEMLFICATELHEDTEKYALIEIFIYSCSSLSILSLIILILIHAALPSLMTLHGKNLMALSISSLVGHVLFLTCPFLPHGIQNVLTMINHFCWLSTFSWMTIIAFDIARKFFARNILIQGTGNDKRRFRLYCLVGWGLPLTIVVTSAVLDHAVERGIIGYNGNEMCWISNRTARLYVFFIPVLISFVTSMICFGVAMYGIESSRRSAISVTKQPNDRNMCLIYTKLATILGITWSLVFISSNVNVVVLSYVSNILNGLQGLFICLVSICNQKTIKEMRRKNSKSAKNTTFTFSTI